MHRVFPLLMAGSYEIRLWPRRSCLFLPVLCPDKGRASLIFSCMQTKRPVALQPHQGQSSSLAVFLLQPISPHSICTHASFSFSPLRHLTNFYQSHPKPQQQSPNYKVKVICENIRKYIKVIQLLPRNKLC